MTADIVSVPSGAARDRAVPPDRAAGAWRRVFLHCLVVPLVVTAPVTGLALTADHRFNVYWHGAVVEAQPWRVVTANLRTVPMYLGFGNFRPLGRMLEWSVDTLAFVLAQVAHVPVQITLRLITALAAAVLVAAAVLLAQAVTARGRLFAGPPSRPVALLPFLAGAGLVAAGPLSTTVLFGGLYFLSAALVLAVAAWVCRGPRFGALVVAAGAVLAVTNEVAALAPPLATVAVLARGGRRRPAVLLWLGFLPVFLPVRVLIAAACRHGDCYRNSDLALGRGVATALPNRLTAWLPPLQWSAALRGGGRPSLLVVVVAVVALGVPAARLAVRLPGLPVLDRRPAAALALTGAAVLTLGALLGSVNGQTQDLAAAGQWGAGWRDSPLTLTGGALLVAGLAALAGRAAAGRAALAVLVLAGAASTAATQAYAVRVDRTPMPVVSGAIADEIARFDPTAAGDARRCALLDRFGALTDGQPYSRFAAGELPGTHSARDRMRVTADLATERMYGRPFCRAAG